MLGGWGVGVTSWKVKMAEERPFLQVSCRSTFIMVSITPGAVIATKRHIIYFNNDIYLLIISINDESNFPVSLYICTTVYILFIIYGRHTDLKVSFIEGFFHSIPFFCHVEKRRATARFSVKYYRKTYSNQVEQ